MCVCVCVCVCVPYRERKMFSEPKTHWNDTEWPNYGTQTLARYQGDKVSHFWSDACPLFSTQKHVRKLSYKPL